MAKRTKLPSFLVGIVVIVAFLGFLANLIFSALSAIVPILAIAGATVGVLLLIYNLYVEIYFRGKNFIEIKNSIQKYIDNCNNLNHRINELKNSFVDIKNYNYGSRELTNTSNFNFKRSEWKKSEINQQVYNCSASVLKNASNQPFKYLFKYFNIEVSEETLIRFESILNDFSAAEEGKILLNNEKENVVESARISIPWLIFRFNRERIEKELGFDEFDFSDFYFPVYRFQYVSAGGNSSSNCDIRLDTSNLEGLVVYLNDLVSFRNSVAGQRALMTSRLREKIKLRDNFTCCKCSLSVTDERNLLLEIDHIIPLSRGGITSEKNLQTLCWRCNRSKGSRIENTSNMSKFS